MAQLPHAGAKVLPHYLFTHNGISLPEEAVTIWSVDLLRLWSSEQFGNLPVKEKDKAQAEFEKTVAEAQALYEERWRGCVCCGVKESRSR